MAGRSKVKITVLKTPSAREIFNGNPPYGQFEEPCEIFRVGQEFVVKEDGKMPEGFCTHAWHDLFTVFWTLRYGGNFPWMKEKGTVISCCTDGLRPVIFELKRVE